LLAIGLILFGVLGLGTVGGFGTIWLAFIGVFLLSASGAERALAETQADLAGVHVADVMTRDPVTIASSASAEDLLELASRTGHSAYPVLDDDGHPLGLASVLSAQRLPWRLRAGMPVAELLEESPQPAPLDAQAEVVSAIPALAANPLHRAAVLQAGRLVGLLSLNDVMRAARVRGRFAGA
jgi:CBS domain-containing protein